MNKRITIMVAMLFYACWLFGQQAPGFKVTDIYNTSHDLYGDYLSQGKYVVLEIFFSNNPPSNNIAHDYFKLYETWGKGQFDVQFMSLTNKDFDNNTSILRFTQRYRTTLPHISAEGGSLQAINPYINGQYGQIFILPAFIIIKPDGTVIHNIKGENDQATLLLIDSILIAEGLEKPYIVSGKVTAYENPLQEVDITAQDSTKKMSIKAITDQLGEYTCVFRSKPNEESLFIQPYKNSRPDYGVSSIDLTFIARHILGIERFSQGWQYIAADIDRNKSVNAVDLVLLRKLILGIDTSFQNNTSWRFYPQNYVFEAPEDALLSDFPEAIRYLDMVNPDSNTPDFNGVKIGDINGTSNKLNDPAIRAKTAITTQITQNFDGAEQTITIRAFENLALSGFQFALELSPWSEIKISSDLEGFGLQHYHIENQTIFFTYFSQKTENISPDQDLIKIEVSNSASSTPLLNIKTKFTPEWYDDKLQVLDLQFELEKSWGLIFPNPCYSEINLPKGLKNPFIHIYNIHGVLVKSAQSTHQLDVSSLSRGTYLLTIKQDGNVLSRQKFIKS